MQIHFHNIVGVAEQLLKIPDLWGRNGHSVQQANTQHPSIHKGGFSNTAVDCRSLAVSAVLEFFKLKVAQ